MSKHVALDIDLPASSPERRLLTAVLERILGDLNPNVGPLAENVYNKDQTIAYVYEEYSSDSCRDWGFKWICEALDLDYGFLVETLQAGHLLPEYGECALIVEQNTPKATHSDDEWVYYGPMPRRRAPDAPQGD